MDNSDVITENKEKNRDKSDLPIIAAFPFMNNTFNIGAPNTAESPVIPWLFMRDDDKPKDY